MNYIKKLEELALGSRLKQLSDVIMTDGKHIYARSGMDFDPVCFPVFKLLSEGTPMGVVEIAEELGVSHPNVIQVVKTLTKKGLVTNEVNSKDARKRSIFLSPKGKKLLPQLESLWSDIEAAIGQLLEECRNNLLMSLTEVEGGLNKQSLFDRFETTRKERLMNAVEIVQFNNEYADDFKRLNIEWLEKYFEIEPIDRKVLNNPHKTIIEPGGQILFAILEGEIVGTCAFVKKDEGEFELSKMAVTEKAQGLQIGKKLGQAIVTLAGDNGAKLLFLESNRKLMPALSLYRKLGFVEMPRPGGDTSDYSRADIYMELMLES